MPRRNELSISSPRSRRPIVDEQVAKQFEEQTEAKGAGVVPLEVVPQNLDRPEDKPASNRRGTLQRPHMRKDGVATKSASFHLPVDLVKRLRVAAAISGKSQSSIVEAALSAWLAEK